MANPNKTNPYCLRVLMRNEKMLTEELNRASTAEREDRDYIYQLRESVRQGIEILTKHFNNGTD